MLETGDGGNPKGMSDPWFYEHAQPTTNVRFEWGFDPRPHPVYWVTFGTYEQGQVPDTSQITNAAQISFPPTVDTMTAVLNPDNTWTVTPGA